MRFFLKFSLILLSTVCLANKNVLITGAAGFIGSNFLKYMFDKYPTYNFMILDCLTYAGNLANIPECIKNSPRFEFFYGSIGNYHLANLLMSKANMVVHFAAESHVTNSLFEDSVFFETDVMGTRVLMRALVEHRKNIERYIHISTSEVYGTADYEPMDEVHPLNPKTPYAAAKAGADRLVYAYWSTYDIPAVIVRPFNNYGPRQHPEKVIPAFITQALRGEKLTVHGSGNQTRDWVHTSDVASALDMILHTDKFDAIKNQVLNIGTGIKISILDIAKAILKALDMDESKYLSMVIDRPGQVDCHIANIEKINSLLGWKPKVTFEEGLKETIAWYRENQSWWKDSIIVAKYLTKTAFAQDTKSILGE